MDAAKTLAVALALNRTAFGLNYLARPWGRGRRVNAGRRCRGYRASASRAQRSSIRLSFQIMVATAHVTTNSPTIT
jgi:hypothetical protein